MKIHMDKYLARRWNNARAYKGRDIRRIKYVTSGGRDSIHCEVRSSGGGWWKVEAVLLNGRIINTWCMCSDFGTCIHHSQFVCKHTLAAAMVLKLHLQGIEVGEYETIGEAMVRATNVTP